MLRLCESLTELGFMSADPYAARISALAKTYGFGYDFALFWVQYDGNGNPVAAVSRVDGNMNIYCTEKSVYEELKEFVCAVGFSVISCRKETADKLGFNASKTSYIVKYSGIPAPVHECVLWDYDKKSVYRLLRDRGFEMGEFGDFLADFCSKLNKETAKLAAIAHDELDACASALFVGEKSVLLGAVATREGAQGNGYASRLVKALADSFGDKTVFLFCRNDSLLAFYEKIGFENNGVWVEIIKKEA
ncbi:MAG: GNAT family N-acetyltransferase [Clostridia bacterium]|nr:GNAT family N-acetyltransferase [Clostridia bacterium]